MMTVGTLKALLREVSDDIPVMTYDEGYLTYDVLARADRVAPVKGGGAVDRLIGPGSGHEPGTKGVEVFIIT